MNFFYAITSGIDEQTDSHVEKYTFIIKLMEPLLLESVFWYNQKKIQFENLMRTLYNMDPIIQTLVDICIIFIGFFQWIYFRATHLRIEPGGDWLSMSALLEYPGETNPHYLYNFVEKYEQTDSTGIWTELNDGKLIDRPEHCMEMVYNKAKNTINYDHHTKEILLIIKYSGDYVVRTCIDPSIEYRPVIIPRVKSHVDLLCIEYRHPKMTLPVSITIPKSYFWVGNELLSMAFVQRMLEYQPLYIQYYFDENYVVNIIDQNIQQYQLNRNTYIVLEEDSIRVEECVSPILENVSDKSSDSSYSDESEWEVSSDIGVVPINDDAT